MMDEIKNKVAESGLIALDLADFKPEPALFAEIDLADYLWEGLVLREKEFRTAIQQHTWEQYLHKYVFVHCSADAIVPTWAYMITTTKLEGLASTYVVGSKSDLEKTVIREKIAKLDLGLPEFASGRYIIKGCSDISCPEFAMTELMKKIQPSAKSIMYGEACSTVPIFKRK